MRRVLALCAGVLALACAGIAQLGRTTDWWTYAGDAQRSGWEKNEQRFTKDDVKSFQLLWKKKLDNKRSGVRAILPPVVLGNLIGYRGFKELAFVAGSADNLWAIDADLDKMYWQKHFDSATPLPHSRKSSSTCSAGLSAMPALPAPLVFGRSRTGAAHRSSRPALNIFSVRPVYILSSDGQLHQLNQSDGSDLIPPVTFIPPGSPAQSLNITDTSIYATTAKGCDGQPSAVWSLDLEDASSKAASFAVNGAQIRGLGGASLGSDGTVYAQTGDGKFDAASNDFANTLLSLSSDLKLKDYFVLPNAGSAKDDLDMNVTTPVAFEYQGRDLIVTTGKDGRLYLLDSHSLGGSDHTTPLFRTASLTVGDGTSPDHGVWGSLSSWEDTSGTRYVLAAVWGPRNSEFTAPVSHGETPNGFIAAFKLHDQGGKLTLEPAWVSRDMATPDPPVIAKEVVFALSNGAYTRKIKRSHGMASLQERPQHGSHATLYAFDGATGEEMYSTAGQVTAPGNLSGLSIANGRLYFATTDDTLNVFGQYLEH